LHNPFYVKHDSRVTDITRRVYEVAQVSEDNAKVNGKPAHSATRKPLQQFGYRFKYIITFTQGFNVQNFI